MDLSTRALISEPVIPQFLSSDLATPSVLEMSNGASQRVFSPAPGYAPGVDEAWVPMHAFLDAMQEAVSGVDEYLCVKYWNKPMARLTGVAPEEALHRPLFSLLPRDFERNLEAGLRRLFQQHADAVEGEFSPQHGNSEFFDFSFRMRFLSTQAKRGLAILTLRPALERRRPQPPAKHYETFGLLGQLSAGIAQELTNPLNAICSRIDNIIALSGDHWNEDLEGELHSIITEVYRISHLVNNLLTLSTNGANNLVDVDLNHLIPEAIAFFEHTLNRPLACVTSLQEDLPPVQGDPVLLQSVLQNILRYAIEAAGDDAVPRIQTVLVERPAEVVRSANGNHHRHGVGNLNGAASPHVIIRIEDRGATVAPQILEELFEPLACTKRFGLAIGLGLFISKKILESHGGQIYVQSQSGHGTIFTIVLKA